MITYWAMLLLPIIFTLHPVKADADLRRLTFWLVGTIFILIIGLRYEIGGDWYRYLFVYSYLDNGPFLENFRFKDIGYEFLYWTSIHFFNNIYFVNIMSAIIFIVGLFRFCRTMPLPWMALLISVPFLIVVVSMGYTRQASAVGLLMWGLVDLIKGRSVFFYLFVIFASLFHYTVLVMLPIGLIYSSKKNHLPGLMLFFLIFSVIVYYIFSDTIEHMFHYYITIKYHHSEGAILRTFVTFFTAIIFFIYRKKFKQVFHDEKLWLIFSIVSILILPLAFFYSTFSDRIAIYFLPLQLVVLSRVPVLISSRSYRTIFVLCVLILYISILFVWLNFGTHSTYWLPYQNTLLLS